MENGTGRAGLMAEAERHARYAWAADSLGEGHRVLDAASGTGWGTAFLARHGARAVGVDVSPAAIAEARERHGEPAEFREGDLRELPCEDGEFDRAVCFEALAHVAEPAQVLDELRRVLRPGGLLLVSAPNSGVYPPGNPLHLSEPGPEELEQMLRARFGNVAVHRQRPYLASLLCDTETLALAGPEVEIDVRVTKLAGSPAGSELHTVAAAGDSELPPAPAELALADDADRATQEATLREWQQRAIEAEAETEALRRELAALQS